MNKNLLIGLGVLLAVIVVGFYFVRSPKLNYGPTQSTSTQPVVSVAPSGPVKEIAVSAKEFAYTPSSITVSKGQTVKIDFTNNGTVAHNFTITELNVATKTIGPGETDSVTFTPTTAGTFTFFCSVDGHRDLGLSGSLIVQ